MLERLTSWLERQPTRRVTLVGLLLVSLLAIPDYLTGPQLAFSIFYLLPVALVAGATSFPRGALVGLVAAITWISTDIASGWEFDHPLIPVWNTVTRLGVYLIVAALLSNLRDAYQRARDLAQTDYLTGAANSRAFRQIAADELERARRYRRPFTAAYIDLDNFKRINDTLGHSVGDEVLRGIATAMRQNTRRSDLIARLGGDEFAMLFPETGEHEATAVLEKLNQQVRDSVDGHGLPVTFSIGAVTFLDPPESIDEMVKLTDMLMYDAKAAGKNRVRHIVVGAPAVVDTPSAANGVHDPVSAVPLPSIVG
jgi:diguanylate cyclase (GGDEF)-like protein